MRKCQITTMKHNVRFSKHNTYAHRLMTLHAYKMSGNVLSMIQYIGRTIQAHYICLSVSPATLEMPHNLPVSSFYL